MLPAWANLTEELLRDGQWEALRVESRRDMLHHPGDPLPRYAHALANLNLQVEPQAAIHELTGVSRDETAPMSLRTAAAMQAGRAQWRDNRPEEAARLFRFAFEHAPDHALFLEAGCSLGMLFNANQNLLEQHADLILALQTSRDLWSKQLREACLITPPRARSAMSQLFSWPGQAVVGFYRLAVSPALGQRCSLQPSCSEYFRQASIQYGLLGLAMQADRFYREPSVVILAGKTTNVNGKVLILDPVCDHDFWFRKNRDRLPPEPRMTP